MPSSFAWVDFAEQDRRKMAEVIDLFREQDTRDELGLGVIRDAFADLLFPGTSTIQTRARYFLFVPWIYRRHEDKGTPAVEIARRARRDEIALIDALAEGGEHDGVIGIDKRAGLQRLPSSIYWAGLGVWKIRRFQGSQEQYHRSWDAILRHHREVLVDDDREPVGSSFPWVWDPDLPDPPDALFERASFVLTGPEAEYLQQRILDLGSTLLGHLLSATNPAEDSEFVWVHPQRDSFPAAFQSHVEHARLFSEAMHGAGLVYNLLLSEERGNGEWIEQYRARYSSWANLIVRRGEAFRAWCRNDFWALVESTGARLTFQARRFVNAWLDLALGPGSPSRLADSNRHER